MRRSRSSVADRDAGRVLARTARRAIALVARTARGENALVARTARGAIALMALAGCGGSPVSSVSPGSSAPAVPTTSGVAPGCPEGEVLVASQGDVARLASCATLRGLTVRSGAALDVSALRALTAVTGDLVIGPTVAIEDVHLGALRAVGGAIRVVGNGLLRGLYLPRLESAGAIAIDGNAVLTTISLPQLAAVRGGLQITDDASLEAVELSALVSLDQELVLAGVPRLELIDAEQLAHAAAVRVDAPRLPPEIADRLRAVAAP